MFEEREKQMFSLLEEANKKLEFVLIGGYAINSYTLPRFSVDCDVVVKNAKEMKKFEEFLEKNNFKQRAKGKVTAYKGDFVSLIKKPEIITFDILSQSIEDRQSGTIIPAKTIFQYSSIRTIFGKGSPIQIKIRVADAEMLFIMKAITGRTTDIRDIFMLASTKLDSKKIIKIRKEILPQKQHLEKVIQIIESKDFKNSLQGVYGKLPEKQFETTKNKLKAILKLFYKE